MTSITSKILLAFLIISMLSYRILSVLPDDISDPFTCVVDQNCSITERCINNLCVDACTEVTCSLSRMCVHGSPHEGYCTCRKTYKANPNMCVSSCHDDDDCHPSRECRPDENNFYECACRPEYAPDPLYPEYACRYLCENDNECANGSICKNGMCFDFCDSEHCLYEDEICLMIGRPICLTNETMYKQYNF